MKLYVNGDSHTAAAEAVNTHAFAEDDGQLYHLGRQPHPDNFAVSWARQLATLMGAALTCDAESASSNTRILRTARSWLESNRPDLVIIQWSTWEREEWFHQGTYLQVGSSGLDHVPAALQEHYRNFVISTNWMQKTQEAHEQIWQFHLELQQQQIPHVFFNGNTDFNRITEKRNWGMNYIAPYDPSMTYNSLLRNNGIQPVASNSWHFGPDGHSFFAQFMLQYCIDHQFY